MITLPLAVKLLGVSKPTANKAIAALESAKIVSEISGKRRDRLWAYRGYLEVLGEGTEIIA
jgi:Fic family protein